MRIWEPVGIPSHVSESGVKMKQTAGLFQKKWKDRQNVMVTSKGGARWLFGLESIAGHLRLRCSDTPWGVKAGGKHGPQVYMSLLPAVLDVSLAQLARRPLQPPQVMGLYANDAGTIPGWRSFRSSYCGCPSGMVLNDFDSGKGIFGEKERG